MFSGLKDRLFYGWVIVAAFFLAGATLWGIRFSFGVFFKSIESEFLLTRAATSAIFSVYMVFGSAFALLSGWALDRYGPRIILSVMGLFAGLSLLLTSQAHSAWLLFVTYSLLLAMGSSAAYVVTMSTTLKWFDKKRGLALGITSSGGGLGLVVMAPLATYLVDSLGWRGAFIVLGLMAWLIVIPLSQLLRNSPQEIGVLPDGIKSAFPDTGLPPVAVTNNNPPPVGLSLPQALKTRSFWLIVITWVFFASAIFLVLTHIVPHATDIGFSAVEAAAVLSVIGGANIGGRVLMGAVSDKIGRNRTTIICLLSQALALVWLIWVRELWMLYLFALIFGFAYGGVGPSMAALIGDTFGLNRIGVIMGALEVGYGLGAAIGPVIGGLVYDISNNYFLAFLIGALTLLVAVMAVALIRQEKPVALV
ncbi:MAG: MFS transporter [Dehalococcoidales bacterium]|nr:MFS transporter [Dehalococcoidales bacterium]